MALGTFSGLINVLSGFFTWTKWFLPEWTKDIGKWFTRFWGVVVLAAGWVWVGLTYVWDTLVAVAAHISQNGVIEWPSWTNTVGHILARANVIYPLEEHFKWVLVIVGWMAFLLVLKILRKLFI